MGAVRAIIIDDDAKRVKLFKLIIKSLNIEIVGEGQNGVDAVTLYKTLKPDVVFLDIDMPVKDGITALREIMAEFPLANVIMITSQDNMYVVEDCIAAGARDYIRKDSSTVEIKDRIASEIRAITGNG